MESSRRSSLDTTGTCKATVLVLVLVTVGVAGIAGIAGLVFIVSIIILQAFLSIQGSRAGNGMEC
jgi:hypothetical protein